MSYYCYLLISENKTYIGITNNLLKRLDQHNGLIKGGAKSTRTSKNWIYHTIIGIFKNKSDVCKFEWNWKNQLINNKWRKTKSGIENKLKRLEELLVSTNLIKIDLLNLRGNY
jgi:predicted GIY-YIG superfamily endonuclease